MYLVSLSKADFLWVLGSLCEVHRTPFESALLLQRFPAPHSIGRLIDAAGELGFSTGHCVLDSNRLSKLPLPCIGFLRSQTPESKDRREASGDDRPQELRPLLLLKADDTRAMYFAAGTREPTTVLLAELGERMESILILVRRRQSDDLSEKLSEANRASFGFSWFWRELLRYRRIWRDVLLASFFIQVIGLATPLFTQVVIDKVVVHHTASTLIAVVCGLVMFMLFGSAMTWLRQYLLLHTGNRIDAVLGSHVFRHLLRVVLPYFEHRPTGTLVARLHAVENIREFMASAAVSLILDLPFLVVFIAVMFAYSWQLTLIALAMLSLVTAVSFVVAPVLRMRLNQQFLLGARNQAFVTEYIAGMETVKSLQMEAALESRYDELLATYLSAGFSSRQLSNTYTVSANALEQAMTIALLCVGALLVMRNDGFTIGMLVAFQMFAARMSQPMLRLAGLWQEFQQASIAVKRLGDIMDAPAELHTLTPCRPRGGSGEVRIDDISFRYSPQHPYLYRGLSLTLKPGKLTVVTGPSGSGKSTLAKILLGFYCPEDGQVLIDQRDIRHLSVNELRQNFGVVPQETYLFSGPIYENLLAANPNAGFPEVVDACKVAEIHDFIERLPKGYNTTLGEHGVGLSGGQKQRLSIARALLRHPRILIFDEATSNLDQATAEYFAHTVNRLRGKVTILFIAHQLPKDLQVDEVVVLGDSERRVSVVAGDTGA